jgi:hypothetical protein
LISLGTPMLVIMDASVHERMPCFRGSSVAESGCDQRKSGA